jgi:hypothetical protein
MSLSFLVPAFLAGLLALAVPVIIHLTRRQTKQPLGFPSLMFVRQIPDRTVRKRHLHRWPLFLLRCAALALLVLAFARPFLQSRDATAATTISRGAREVVILLDRSYSMGYGDRWTRAQRAAEEAIADLGANDRASVVLFDAQAEGSRATMDHALLRATVRDAEPGPRITRYAPALRQAQRILSASTLPRREVVLISDFQRSGLAADGAEIGGVRLPAGTRVTPVSVADAKWTNGSVASVDINRTPSAGRERVTVTARLTGPASGAGSERRVMLEIDGREMETRTISTRPAGSASVTFNPFILPEGHTVRGAVRSGGDPLAVDDAFYFALAPDPRIPVLIINGPAAGAGSSFFLQHALDVGEEPGFRTIVRSEFRPSDLASRPVVILNQTPFPDGEIGKRLQSFVEDGGGVVQLLGDTRSGGWTDVLPGVGSSVDRTAQGGTTLGYVDLGHPVFEPFSTPRSGDFTAAHVYRYRPIAAQRDQRVLARFGDGATALAEQRVGRGRVLTWASTLDTRWNDLALQPVFLPFVHQLLKYSAGYAANPSSLTVGDPWDPASARVPESFSLALAPTGERLTLDGSAPLTVAEPGFYEMRERGSGARGPTLAVNVDRVEGSLEPFAPDELVRALALSPATGTPVAGGDIPIAERERAQSAWWYLVVLAFLLLAAETVLSNRAPRAVAPSRG